ncbi:MAG TPA: glycosyltransferase family 9 protein [Usitatibacter sp.]|nr:glycosyltransferase family 9 protein [Usitatibacter sp.]
MSTAWNPRPRRIAVFRALALGDMLCAVPALRALRAHAPEARITLIGLPWAQSFVERFHAYVDDLLPFPGFPGYPEREGPIPDFLDFLRAARERRFDLAIQLHGSGELTNRIVGLLEAKRVAGFVGSEEKNVAPEVSGARVDSRVRGNDMIPWPDHANEIHRYLALMEHLGVPLKGDRLELPITWTDWELWEEVARRHRLLAGNFVCVHPGARLPSRRWPAARFAAVGAALARQGYTIAVTGSPGEAQLTAEVAAQVPGAVDLTGETTLGSLAAAIAKSALVVCNDTGVSHVAAAVGAASVVVASGSDVRRWRPLDLSLHPVIWRDMACRPCAHEVCPVGHGCALGVTVDEVLGEARRMLDQRRVPHAA